MSGGLKIGSLLNFVDNYANSSVEKCATPSETYSRDTSRALVEFPLRETSVDQSTLLWKTWTSNVHVPAIVPSEGDVLGDNLSTVLLRNYVVDSKPESPTKKYELTRSLKAFQDRHRRKLGEKKYEGDPVNILNRPPTERTVCDKKLARSRPGSSHGAPNVTDARLQKTPRPKSSPVRRIHTTLDADQAHDSDLMEYGFSERNDRLSARRPISAHPILTQYSHNEGVEFSAGDTRNKRVDEDGSSIVHLHSVWGDTLINGKAPEEGHHDVSFCLSDVSGDVGHLDELDEESHGKQVENLSSQLASLRALDAHPFQQVGRGKYTFEPYANESPAYEFAEVFPIDEPEELETTTKSGPTKQQDSLKKTPSKVVDDSINILKERLERFAQLQAETIEIEEAQLEKAKAIRQRHAMSKVYRMSKATSARTWREKTCWSHCVQPACVGDCPQQPPDKSPVCQQCDEVNCGGRCGTSVYDSRSRHEASDDEGLLLGDSGERLGSDFGEIGRPKSGRSSSRERPKSGCLACDVLKSSSGTFERPRSHRTATPERPRSSYSTTDRPKSGRRGPVERPKSSQVTLERPKSGRPLLIRPKSSPATLGTSRKDLMAPMFRKPGRAGVMPGKSYFSQRRVSLTKRR